MDAKILALLGTGISQYIDAGDVINNSTVSNLAVTNSFAIPVVSALPTIPSNGNIVEFNGNLYLGNGTAFNQIGNLSSIDLGNIATSNIGNLRVVSNLYIPNVATLPPNANLGSLVTSGGNLFLGNGTAYNQIGNLFIAPDIVNARQLSANVITQIPNTQNALLTPLYDEPAISYSNGAFVVNSTPISNSSWNTFTTPDIQELGLRSTTTGGNTISVAATALPKFGESFINVTLNVTNNGGTTATITQSGTATSFNSTGAVVFENGTSTTVLGTGSSLNTFIMTARWLNTYASGAYRNVAQEIPTSNTFSFPIPAVGPSPNNGTTVVFYKPVPGLQGAMANVDMLSYITSNFPSGATIPVTFNIEAKGLVT